MTIIITGEPDNTQRAKGTRQYPKSQKHQTIPRESKVLDNTRRAKCIRQYPESQKCQTIPRETKVLDNTWRAKDFFFQNYCLYKNVLGQYHFY